MIRPLLILSFVVSASAADIRWLDDFVIQKAQQAVVGVRVRDDAATTGFFASEDGLVVTSASPLEGARRVVVIINNKEEIKGAHLMAVDPATDLAVLATGRKAPAFLLVPGKPPAVGERCAVVFHVDGKFKTADGMLLARREQLDWTETRFLEIWSVGVNPNVNGLTGAPVITRDGRVVGMCDLVTGTPPQKFVFAIPEEAIASVLARARAASRPIEFPQPGEISHGGVPGDPDYIEGMKLMSAGNMAGALERFRSSLQRHPQNPLVMIQVASCLANSGDVGESRKILTRLAPERLQAAMLLGEILNRQGDSVRTIQYFQDLTTRFPKLAGAWGFLGENLLQTGRKVEAIAAVRKWTELEPDSMRAWDACSKVLLATGDYVQSDRARDRASELESLFFNLRYSAPKRD